MRVNQKVTGKSMSIAGGVGIGVLASVVITIISSLILAALVNNEIVKENGLGYGVIMVLLLSAVTGSLVAWKCIRHRRLLVCTLSGVGYYVALIGITALLFGGQYQGMGVTALVVLAGCGCVALIGVNGKKAGKYSFKKMLPR